MNYDESIQYLDAHIGQGVKPGLERIANLLEAMGSPHTGYPILHVAGTNGKTSTSRMATALLLGHGLATGTYISPHLERVEERLSINSRYATQEEFALAVSDVAVFADLLVERGSEPSTYFELTTAAAFAFFADQAVNAAVLEVGLGGRLDATNVVDADVCVVTGIGVEHTEFLGEDLATIAGEKLGIVGPSSLLDTGELPTEALDVAHLQKWEFITAPTGRTSALPQPSGASAAGRSASTGPRTPTTRSSSPFTGVISCTIWLWRWRRPKLCWDADSTATR